MENHDNFIQKIHQKMEASNVLLAFTGEVNMRIINAMINSVRNKLDSEESTPRIQKKVYSIMVECLESLFYGYINTPVETDRFNKYSIFTISRNQHGYHLISGNYLLLESMTAQKNLIEKISQTIIMEGL